MATIAAASLNAKERRMLDRLIGLLEREYGEELLAVWMFGSRARGDAHEHSDIDLMVVTTGGHEDERRVSELVDEVEDDDELHWSLIRALVVGPATIAKRRRAETWLQLEVDRDKIVLRGGEVDPPEGFTWHEPGGPVRQRTREYLAEAHEQLKFAEFAWTARAASNTVDRAYYVVFNAAVAALSEEDRFARTHDGTWTLTRQLLVKTGKLPAGLHRRARRLQPAREKAVYAPLDPDESWKRPTLKEAEAALETARSYLQAVEDLLGV